MTIPEALRPALDRALMKTFGTIEFDAAPTPLTGGLSGAQVLRIRVGGIAYALRLTLARDPLRDPERGFACLRTAAEACLSPTVRYADAADGVAIMDLVAVQPLAAYPGDGAPLLVELAQAVRVLHRTPAFPPLVDYMTGVGELIAQHRAGGLIDPAATEELSDRFAGLARAYRTAPGDLVSSHNDLNPGNILYDGRRLWIVDWEAAFLADRYVDLATLANWFVKDPGGEDLLLRTYFGAPPTPEQRARFEVMRIVNHLFLGTVFHNAAAAERPGQTPADRTLAAPSLAEMHRGLGSGAVSFASWDDRVAYGKARLTAALDGLRSPALAEALETLAA
ncbi:phosphotransferase [Phenylobacterium sp.]|uniref:phosphotransferase n=1 Tax=Phenylobacterium sp. TaxID=1871053 RepID=UPI003564B3AF